MNNLINLENKVKQKTGINLDLEVQIIEFTKFVLKNF